MHAGSFWRVSVVNSTNVTQLATAYNRLHGSFSSLLAFYQVSASWLSRMNGLLHKCILQVP